MQYPDNYFDDEVRDGFFVPGLIKRAWAAELEVLEAIDKVCQKYGIRWFADYGTLLGAVRHSGFIPWDDDMDICMLREDYDKFNEIAKKELGGDYYVMNVHDALDYDDMITRVNSDSKINYSKMHVEKYHQFPYPAGVDIFALDYVSPDENEENFRKEMVKLVVDVINQIKSQEGDQGEILEAVRSIEQLCNVKFDEEKSLVRQLGDLADRLFSLYTRDDGATEVALMNFWIENNDHKFKLDYYKDIVKLPFENMMINAPAMYDALLKNAYGDYMKLVHAGGLHNYPYFGAAEEEAEKVFENGLPYKYYYSADDMRMIKRDNRNIRREIKEQIKMVTESLKKFHESMSRLATVDDEQLILQLLANSQEVSINLGNMIENNFKNTEHVIGSIEEYCETLYNMYELIASGEAAGSESKLVLCRMLGEALSKFVNETQKICRRREVVFLPYKVALWDSFDGLWRECMQDEDCDVYVIPIPYYYKDARCDVLKEVFEGNDFPKEVSITDYNKYDLISRHPDEIYIQCPYDKCNAVISVEPYFYASNIVKYTDKLVFVPPFVMDEIESDDEKALKNTKDYICSPGVIFADKVIAQSERMKQTYVELLTEFAGEDSKAVWEEKIDGCGLPRKEETAHATKERLFSTLPEEWKKIIYKDDGSKRKIVVYKNNISAVLQFKEKYIEKLRTVLNTFMENKDNVVLLWVENKLVDDTLKKVYPTLWDKYSKIVDSFKKEKCGIYDESVLSQEQISIVGDAYYGETDCVIQKFTRKKKPVMIENVEIM